MVLRELLILTGAEVVTALLGELETENLVMGAVLVR